MTSGPLKIVSYSDEDLAVIAEALALKGIDASVIMRYREHIDRAAYWLASMKGYRSLIPETARLKKLNQIAVAADRVVKYGSASATPDRKAVLITESNFPRPSPQRYSRSAAKLLDLLDMNPDNAADELPDQAIQDALTSPGDGDAPLLRLINDLTDYAINVDATVQAAEKLAKRAREGALKVKCVRELIVRLGKGNAATDRWIDDMLNLYVTITRRRIARSVRWPGGVDGGKPSGPLLRFLKAAGQPVDLKFSDKSWMSRIDTAIAHSTKNNLATPFRQA